VLITFENPLSTFSIPKKVHDNTVRHCTVHVIDFDAYTTNSAAWSNLVEENNQVPGSQGEGIFVEETATNNL
jgi:hypothetical protein